MRKRTTQLYTIFFALLLSFVGTKTLAQMGFVKGTVSNYKETLDGVSIIVEGKGKATHTNTTGNYTLQLKPGTYNLIVTYVGHQRKNIQITIANKQVLTVDIELIKIEELQKVTVVGTRSKIIRSNTQTVAPIDIISSKELLLTGQVEPTQMINFIAPSFNSSRQTIADGTDHIDPATLRGLGPDQVLVLVNGKRRHTTALVNVNGTIGRGSVGTDLNAIPTSAIEKIEILRDGAASQYGSDAIGGVINVVLKKDVKRTNLNVHLGQHYAGDGLMKSINANHAIKLGKKGFLDVFADVRLREGTNRVGEYTGTVYTNNVALDNQLIIERGFSRKNNLLLGNSKADNIALGVNIGFPITNTINFTGNILTNSRKGEAAGFYRYPKQTSQVILELYPDGFLPRILSNIQDRSFAVAIDGTTNGWKWDIGNTYGFNALNYHVNNSNNASQFALGKNAPTAFYAGKLFFGQNTFNLNAYKDFAKEVQLKSFNVAWGAELRMEKYKIDAGEEASYRNYDPSSGKAGGSQVFPGFQPSNAVDEGRTTTAAYVDVESDVNNHFMFNAAARYEHYSDFGGNFAGKLSARYKINPALTFRGTISNGFRAPSLHQRLFSNVSTLFQTINNQLVATQNLTARNETALANAFGIPKLGAEKSVQMSIGITSTPFKSNPFSITVDAYQINIKDRIVLTGTFTKASSPVINNLLTAFPDVNSVSFFTNAIATKTQGLDIVASTGAMKTGKGILELTLALNFNRTEVNDIKVSSVLAADPNLANGTLFNRLERGRFEWAQPRNKAILGANYRIAKWTLMGRVTHFGTIKTFDATNPLLDEDFSPKLVTDLSIGYRPIYWMNVTFGANNIGNVYPDQVNNFANTSDNRLIYSRAATQFGFNGGYWYTNIAFDLTNVKKIAKPKPSPPAPVVIQPQQPAPPTDSDGDGVPDKIDACPTQKGLANLYGCPDRDADGIADKEDECPSVAGIKKMNGCPDTDGDGIEDAKDKCPQQLGSIKYQGCPTPDTDNDGLNDDYDKCPTVAGLIANDGCPESKKVMVEKKVNETANNILFITGSAVLTTSSYTSLNAIATDLKEDDTIELIIEGHTDNIGTAKTNQTLSEARANTVKKYLLQQGVAAKKITTIGFGATQPIATNDTPEGRAQNRRVILKLQ
jgi:iron complex outermembrane receptor protein